jgi:predicted Ser/Thr protein kinase/Tfp pilus assembly protein PilF
MWPMRFKGLFRATFCLLIVLPFSLCAQNAYPEAEAHYQNGVQAKTLDEKIKHFEKAVALQPDFLDAVYQLGVTFFRKSQYEAAIRHLARAAALNHGDYKESRLYLRNAYRFQAMALNEKGDPEAALAYALEATKLDESFAPAYATLGLVQFNLKNWDAARRAFEQSLRLKSNQDTVWVRLGDAYFRSENYPQAVMAYERALSRDPTLKEAQAHLKIAMTRATPGAWLAAYEQIKKEGRPDEARALLVRANTIFVNDAHLTRKMDETKWEADYLAADAAIAIGSLAEALEILQKIDPAYKDVALKIAELQATIAAQRDSLAETIPSSKKDTPKARAAKTASPQKSLAARRATSEPEEASVPEKTTTDSFATGIADSETFAVSNPAERVSEVDSTITTSNGVPPTPVQSQGFSAMHWVAAGVSGLLLLGLGFIKFGKPVWAFAAARWRDWRQPSASRGRELSDNTIEFFKDRVASITPIKFEPIDPQTMTKRKRGKTTLLKRETPTLEATQTILGGIKKVKRIGRYIVEKEIGRGTMGLIYKAWDPKLDRTVVIKQVAFDALNSVHEAATLKDRLFREARAAGRLNHPNIVIIYDVDEDKNFSYIVMEYLQGKDLKLLLEKEIRFDLMRTINIVSQICSALDYAHQMGIIHRDIKPSNIILTQNNHVKVADFGIAKLPHFGTLTQTGSIIGTPYYMSPEQIEGRKLDGRSDLFSTGVILYELLTGVHPFPGDTIPSVVYKIVHQQPKPPSTVREDLPRTLDNIVSRALAKDPEQRYATALDLIIDLESIQGELLKHEV